MPDFPHLIHLATESPRITITAKLYHNNVSTYNTNRQNCIKFYVFYPQKGKEGFMEREQTTIRLPADLKEQIQRKADEEGQS